jgi:hypothetical protein
MNSFRLFAYAGRPYPAPRREPGVSRMKRFRKPDHDGPTSDVRLREPRLFRKAPSSSMTRNSPLRDLCRSPTPFARHRRRLLFRFAGRPTRERIARRHPSAPGCQSRRDANCEHSRNSTPCWHFGGGLRNLGIRHLRGVGILSRAGILRHSGIDTGN